MVTQCVLLEGALLVDNIYQIPTGVQGFVVLKVTENNIKEAFPEYKCPTKPNQLHHCKQKGRMKYRLKRQQTTAIPSSR